MAGWGWGTVTCDQYRTASFNVICSICLNWSMGYQHPRARGDSYCCGCYQKSLLRNESLSLMLGISANSSMDLGKVPCWYLALSNPCHFPCTVSLWEASDSSLDCSASFVRVRISAFPSSRCSECSPSWSLHPIWLGLLLLFWHVSVCHYGI